MTGKTHVSLGTAIGISLCTKLPGEIGIISMGVLAGASLLPDVDHPKSILNKYILPIKNKTNKLLIYGGVGILIIAYNMKYKGGISQLNAIGALFIIIALSSHRNGLTHSIAGLISFSFIANYLAYSYNKDYLVYYFIIGYLSHLIADMFTSRGVPLFYPFKDKNIKFPVTFRVGSKSGKLIEDIIIVSSVIYILYKLPLILHLK
ncbi:MAG: metal-dependent hydrolase [Clostridium sp.]|nr:metal-dependent hydrolase [Clostridium sp.]